MVTVYLVDCSAKYTSADTVKAVYYTSPNNSTFTNQIIITTPTVCSKGTTTRNKLSSPTDRVYWAPNLTTNLRNLLLQFVDTVGWMTGRASSLEKTAHQQSGNVLHVSVSGQAIDW